MRDSIERQVAEPTEEDLLRQLAEVDDLLSHASLTSAQRAIHTQRRKALYLQLHPDGKRFSEDTARRTGRHRRTVEMDAQRGEMIPADVLQILSGSDLGRGQSLNAIMRMLPDQQRVLCDHIRAGRSIEARQIVSNAMFHKVVELPGNCTKEVRRQLMRLEAGWKAASDDARQRFLARLDKRGDIRKCGLKLEKI